MLTFSEMKQALRVHNADPSTWHYRSRGVILGKMHAHKLSFWKYFIENCPHDGEVAVRPPPTRGQLIDWIHSSRPSEDISGTALTVTFWEGPVHTHYAVGAEYNSEHFRQRGTSWMRCIIKLRASMLAHYKALRKG